MAQAVDDRPDLAHDDPASGRPDRPGTGTDGDGDGGTGHGIGVREVFLVLIGAWTAWYAWLIHQISLAVRINTPGEIALVLIGWAAGSLVLGFLMPAVRWMVRQWMQD